MTHSMGQGREHYCAHAMAVQNENISLSSRNTVSTASLCQLIWISVEARLSVAVKYI